MIVWSLQITARLRGLRERVNFQTAIRHNPVLKVKIYPIGSFLAVKSITGRRCFNFSRATVDERMSKFQIKHLDTKQQKSTYLRIKIDEEHYGTCS